MKGSTLNNFMCLSSLFSMFKNLSEKIFFLTNGKAWNPLVYNMRAENFKIYIAQ
jgi:hypothetical protein